MFGFELPSVLLDRRTRKFLEKNEKFMSWGENSKIDYNLVVMFFTKLITVMFTLCLLIVFSSFIMLYVFLLLVFFGEIKMYIWKCRLDSRSRLYQNHDPGFFFTMTSIVLLNSFI